MSISGNVQQEAGWFSNLFSPGKIIFNWAIGLPLFTSVLIIWASERGLKLGDSYLINPGAFSWFTDPIQQLIGDSLWTLFTLTLVLWTLTFFAFLILDSGISIRKKGRSLRRFIIGALIINLFFVTLAPLIFGGDQVGQVPDSLGGSDYGESQGIDNVERTAPFFGDLFSSALDGLDGLLNFDEDNIIANVSAEGSPVGEHIYRYLAYDEYTDSYMLDVQDAASETAVYGSSAYPSAREIPVKKLSFNFSVTSGNNIFDSPILSVWSSEYTHNTITHAGNYDFTPTSPVNNRFAMVASGDPRTTNPFFYTDSVQGLHTDIDFINAPVIGILKYDIWVPQDATNEYMNRSLAMFNYNDLSNDPDFLAQYLQTPSVYVGNHMARTFASNFATSLGGPNWWNEMNSYTLAAEIQSEIRRRAVRDELEISDVFNDTASLIFGDADTSQDRVLSFLNNDEATPSSALVTQMMLYRILNIPSRIVFGFVGGDFSEDGSSRTLKTKHFSGWVEAYLPFSNEQGDTEFLWVPFQLSANYQDYPDSPHTTFGENAVGGIYDITSIGSSEEEGGIMFDNTSVEGIGISLFPAESNINLMTDLLLDGENARDGTAKFFFLDEAEVDEVRDDVADAEDGSYDAYKRLIDDDDKVGYLLAQERTGKNGEDISLSITYDNLVEGNRGEDLGFFSAGTDGNTRNLYAILIRAGTTVRLFFFGYIRDNRLQTLTLSIPNPIYEINDYTVSTSDGAYEVNAHLSLWNDTHEFRVSFPFEFDDETISVLVLDETETALYLGAENSTEFLDFIIDERELGIGKHIIANATGPSIRSNFAYLFEQRIIMNQYYTGEGIYSYVAYSENEFSNLVIVNLDHDVSINLESTDGFTDTFQVMNEDGDSTTAVNITISGNIIAWRNHPSFDPVRLTTTLNYTHFRILDSTKDWDSSIFGDTPYTLDGSTVYPEVHLSSISAINGEFDVFVILLTTQYRNGVSYMSDNRIGAGSGRIYSISVIHQYGLIHNDVAFGQTHQVSPFNFRVRDAPFIPFGAPSTSGTSSLLASDVPSHNSQETILTTLVPSPAVQQEQLLEEQLINIHFSTNKPSGWEKVPFRRYYT